MASVRKRTWTTKGVEKSAWLVDYKDSNGERTTDTFKLKKDADAFKRKVEAERADGINFGASRKVTFGEALDAWLKDCERRHRIGDGMAGGTLAGYRSVVRCYFDKQVRGVLLGDLRTSDLQRVLDVQSEKLQAVTIERLVIVINQTLKYAMRQEWIGMNPLSRVALRTPKGERRRRVLPSKHEIDNMLQTLATRRLGEKRRAHKHRVAFVLLAVCAGLRRGEICGLRWENIDLERRLMHIKHSYSSYDGLKLPKTKAGIRPIPMSKPVFQLLSWMWNEDEEKAGYILKTCNNGPISPNNLHKCWKIVCREAGFINEDGTHKYTFHSLRHAAVSLWIEQGLQPFHIKAIAGHSSITMTMDIYGHLFPEDETGRKAIEGASEQFAFAVPERTDPRRIRPPQATTLQHEPLTP